MDFCCGYSGDVILITHIDSLNHFSHGVYNGFDADEHLGSRAWCGSEQIVPIITRGLLLDIAAFKGVECLSPSYGISIDGTPQRPQPRNRAWQSAKATPYCCALAEGDTGRTAHGCSATALASL